MLCTVRVFKHGTDLVEFELNVCFKKWRKTFRNYVWVPHAVNIVITMNCDVMPRSVQLSSPFTISFFLPLLFFTSKFVMQCKKETIKARRARILQEHNILRILNWRKEEKKMLKCTRMATCVRNVIVLRRIWLPRLTWEIYSFVSHTSRSTCSSPGMWLYFLSVSQYRSVIGETNEREKKD